MYQTLKVMILGTAFFAGSCSVETPEHKTAACTTSSKGSATSDTSLALAEAAPASYNSPSEGTACSVCHGADGKMVQQAQLDTYAANHSKEDFETILSNGTNDGMPAYPNLESDEVDEMWLWLQSFDESSEASTTTSSTDETDDSTTTETTTTTTESEESEEEVADDEDEDDDSSSSSGSSSSKKC